jgi:hypothetical protein
MFTKPLLPWRKGITHICVFAARVGDCTSVRAGVSAQARACARARVALLIRHATRMRRIVCGLSGSTTFSDIISYTARFPEKNITEHKMRVLIFSKTFYLKYFLFQVKST